MPNHETNTVVIIGEPEKIAAFVQEGTRSARDVVMENEKASAEARKLGGFDAMIAGKPLTEEEVEASIAEMPERIIDFRLIVPQPENLEKGGCSGEHAEGEICWYTWQINAWGTKWNAYTHTHFQHRVLRTYGDGAIYGRVDLVFETAWSQPTPIFKAIEERWGVTVHAVTQDEGGYPDVEYGDPYESETLGRKVTIEFDCYDKEV